MPSELSKKQTEVLAFIKEYIVKNNVSPTLVEIAEFLDINTKSTINQHLSALEKKGYITRLPGTYRGIIVNEIEEGTIDISLLGIVAAGQPIEAIEDEKIIKIPKRIVPQYNSNYFALEVSGNSMIDDGIYNGEIIILEKRNFAQNGDLVVAKNENGEATLKYFYQETNRIRLEPRNPNLQPFYWNTCEIVGIMRGLTSSKSIN